MILTEIRARLHLPTPAFWQRLRTKCLLAASTLGTATVGLALLPQEHPLVKMGTYIVGGGTMVLVGIATGCAFAVVDPTQIPEQIEKL